MTRHLRPPWLAMLLVVSFSGPSLGELPQQELRFLDGLRARRLFSVAEDACRQGRERATEASQRGDWTVELLKVLAARAVNANRSQRTIAWQAARAEAQSFLQQEPDNAGRWLVRYQDALTLQAWAELLQYEAGDIRQANDREAALQLLRNASASWDQLIADLDRELSVVRSSGGGPQALGETQLHSLKLNAAYQQSRALRFRAAAYQPKSNDHTAALQQSLKKLEEVRVSLPEGNDLLWEVYADLLACRRELQQWPEAEQAWLAADVDEAPPNKTQRVRAEAMRWRTATGQPQRALEMHQAATSNAEFRSPDVDLALLEALLFLWRDAEAQQRRPEAARLKQQVEQTATFIDQQHGPFWRRRADLLLLRDGPTDAISAQGQLAQRQARELVLQGKVEEAIDLLDDAAVAAPGDDSELSFTLTYQAASLARQLGREGEFLERVRDLSMKHPQAKQAGPAHLQAIVASIALARTDPSMEQLYQDLLAEHLEHFGDQESANQARLWRAQVQAHQRQYEQAAGTLLDVAPDSPLAATAARHAGLIALDRWEASTDSAAEVGRLVAAFRKQAEQAEASANPKAHRAWTAWAVMLHLAFDADRGSPSAESEAWMRIVEPAVDDDSSDDSADTRVARAMLFGASHRGAEALAALSNVDDSQVLGALPRLLAQAAQRGDEQPRRGSAELLLKVLELPPLRSSEQGPQAIERATLRAQAMRWAGREDEALALTERLAREQPRDAALQVAWGQLLLDSKDPRRQQQALEQWRKIAASAKPRTALWYRAKYSVALASFQAGDKQEAARLIRFLQATTDWRDCPNRDAFEQLLRRCDP